MVQKQNIPILKNHDPSQIIGHINPFINNTTFERYVEIKIETTPDIMKKILSWGCFNEK